jgi:hypothetical protein
VTGAAIFWPDTFSPGAAPGSRPAARKAGVRAMRWLQRARRVSGALLTPLAKAALEPFAIQIDPGAGARHGSSGHATRRWLGVVPLTDQRRRSWNYEQYARTTQ